MLKEFSFSTATNDKISVSLYRDKNIEKHPCVIYVHGFKGFKDWGFIPYIAQKMTAQGFSFLAFNFSHNGIGENPEVFTELDKFSLNTHSLEVSEVMEVIRLCVEEELPHTMGLSPIFLMGHSRGGGAAILAAEKSPYVKAICTWASVYTYERYEKAEIQQWKQKGFVEVVNTRTGQIFKIGLPLLEDVLTNGQGSLNILNAVRKLNKPYMILHGDIDTTVHFYEAEQLNLYGDPALSHYELIRGGNHTFGAVHPFSGTTPELEKALQATIRFFKENL